MEEQSCCNLYRGHYLTIEEVKSCQIFSNLTDEQALEVIRTFKDFTEIVYDYYFRMKGLINTVV